MHTVELLNEAIGLAQSAGYRIRQDWLGGSGGGDCEIKGQRWLFLDLAVGPEDQLEQVLDTLRRDPRIVTMPMADPLGEVLGIRKSA